MHDVIEWWSKTGQIRYEPSEHLYEQDGVTKQVTWEQVRPYVDRFLEWVADFGITPVDFIVCEATVWHHDDGWAGTLDGILRIRPITAKSAKLCARIHASNGRGADRAAEPVCLVLDNKSRENDGKAFYPEYALQSGGAYRHGQTMTTKLGVLEIEMPHTDGAVILQLRPDGWNFEPVASGQREYRAFLDALNLFRWSADHGDASVQVGTFPVPDGWTRPTWERATLGSGKLCPCVGCDNPNDGRCLAQHNAVRPIGPHTRTIDGEGNPVAPTARPRKATPPAAAGPQTGKVTVVDREDGSAAFYPPAELLAEQAESGKPVRRAPRKRAAPAARTGAGDGGIMASLGRQATPGATLQDSDIPF